MLVEPAEADDTADAKMLGLWTGTARADNEDAEPVKPFVRSEKQSRGCGVHRVEIVDHNHGAPTVVHDAFDGIEHGVLAPPGFVATNRTPNRAGFRSCAGLGNAKRVDQ